MLENFPYCPTLYSRVAEIKALSQLPAVTKDRIFPLLVARPWPNANKLSKTWEKINEALGGRRFALDLDRSKQNIKTTKKASEDFDLLFDSKNGFENYYNLISEVSPAIPVLRLGANDVSNFQLQAGHINRLDRGVIIRLEHGRVQDFQRLLGQAFNSFNDFSVFIDAGWSPDLLGREGWASSIIEFISRQHPEAEIVITGSSFPETFADLGERGSFSVKERSLYDNLVRRHNSATLIYGDWGSTRPPKESVPMKNIPRIDLPNRREWISFRKSNDFGKSEDYSDIAQRVVDDSTWPKKLAIWGTYVIEWTASGEPGGIRSSSLAASARINIHLHSQAFFDETNIISDGDEPFVDE